MMNSEDRQTGDIKFSEELLNSFDAVNTKSEVGLQIVKDMVEFYKKRAALEESYAKGLAGLHKTMPGSGLFTKETPIQKEMKTLRTALLGTNEVGLKVSEQHQELCNKILNDICKQLEAWIKTKDTERKKISGEGQKHIKTVADAKGAVAKNKENCEKLVKESEKAKEALMKAEKDEINQPDNKKLQPVTRKASHNYNQAVDKVKAADQAYQASVKKANEELDSFRKEKMPVVLEQFQKFEEERWNTMLSSVRTYKNLYLALPPAISDYIGKDLNGLIENAKIDEDLTEFVKATKKEEKVEVIEYTPIKSKYDTEESNSNNNNNNATKEDTKTKDFSTKTAEEKLEEANAAKKSQKQQQDDEEAEQDKKSATKTKNDEDAKKKAQAAKANLFNESDDLFN
jgi:chemotaxis protein histidine kinase CheA